MLFLSRFFFFNDTATTEIYTLSLHDALPISEIEDVDVAGHGQRDARFLDVEEGQAGGRPESHEQLPGLVRQVAERVRDVPLDRKSTRLNSSHSQISYAVFCLKKKKELRPLTH